MSSEQQVSSTPDGTLPAHDVVELDKILDGLVARSTEPMIVVVDGPQNESVYFGIAGRSGFVSKATEPPYCTTVGDATAEGYTAFSFEGHNTEIAKRHLIALDLARQVVRDFFLTGSFSPLVEWEEI